VTARDGRSPYVTPGPAFALAPRLTIFRCPLYPQKRPLLRSSEVTLCAISD